MIKEFHTLDGKDIVFDVPPPRDERSIFIVAGHKTGSTLLTNIIADITKDTGLPSIPVEGNIWRQGISIPEWPQQIYNFLENDGYVFYSFRSLQKLPEVKNFINTKKIFLIRDPRDIAVSYYYSMSKSHGLPKEGKSRDNLLKQRKESIQLTIDEFIQTGKATSVIDNIQKFADYLDDEKSIFYKYEDIIFKKKQWVAQLAKDLNVNLSKNLSDDIANKHDIIPIKENPDAHIRQVKPGGYREKLSRDTISYIYENYPIFFSRFGYI